MGGGLGCLGSMFSTEIDLWTQLQLGETDEQSSNNWVYNDQFVNSKHLVCPNFGGGYNRVAESRIEIVHQIQT